MRVRYSERQNTMFVGILEEMLKLIEHGHDYQICWMREPRNIQLCNSGNKSLSVVYDSSIQAD